MNMLQPAQIRYCCAVFFLFVCLVIYRCSGRFFCALIAFLGSIIQLLWLPEHWVQEKSNHMSFAANFLLYFIFLIIWKDSGEFKLGLSGIFMCVHNLHFNTQFAKRHIWCWEVWVGNLTRERIAPNQQSNHPDARGCHAEVLSGRWQRNFFRLTAAGDRKNLLSQLRYGAAHHKNV